MATMTFDSCENGNKAFRNVDCVILRSVRYSQLIC
jgi:hypothetical protein